MTKVTASAAMKCRRNFLKSSATFLVQNTQYIKKAANLPSVVHDFRWYEKRLG